MTTIAFDGITLAADRQVSEGGIRISRMVKIRRTRDGRLIGGAGSIEGVSELLDWLSEPHGVRDEKPQWLCSRNDEEALEILPCGTVWDHIGNGRARLIGRHQAIGSGAAIALAAMACGKSALDAVKIAARLDCGTGGGLDALPLKLKKG